MSLPLSKTCDPADFDQLTEELAVVDRYFTTAAEQHPMRRWEYALALRAGRTWEQVAGHRLHLAADVGGAGSPFASMVVAQQGVHGLSVTIVDPAQPGPGHGQTLADYLGTRPRLVDAVFCLSVLEHVEDLDQFCYHLGCLVAPGGLLFLTMDFCDGGMTARILWPADVYHFHWMRRRIFNWHMLQRLWWTFEQRDFAPLGTWGRTNYLGQPQVFDYTFAALALVKRA